MKPVYGYHSRALGFTLIEVLMTLTLTALLVVPLVGVLDSGLKQSNELSARMIAAEDARWALTRIRRFAERADAVLAPISSDPDDILILVMDPQLDRDADGFADADNDRDGRVNEDPPADANFDSQPGVSTLDDDGDGVVDEAILVGISDDDEDGSGNEDPWDQIDNDGDGLVDEDVMADLNGDGCSGICGVDDDEDGLVDEGIPANDDEDDAANEDWIDTMAYYLDGDTLMERLPDLNPVDGTAYQDRILLGDVVEFNVTRQLVENGAVVFLISLSCLMPDGETLVLQTGFNTRLMP